MEFLRKTTYDFESKITPEWEPANTNVLKVKIIISKNNPTNNPFIVLYLGENQFRISTKMLMYISECLREATMDMEERN